ncbi:DUF4145 domain-containing protein [Streptomyces sp. NPDC050085]|uniref:DUF4145 domain-containing protein n=1 Tax=Streptomyces sp. NPDC050085 TaxID=3365600 RepID=UPI00379339EB
MYQNVPLGSLGRAWAKRQSGCDYCGNGVAMTKRAQHRVDPDFDAWPSPAGEVSTIVELWSCDYCGKVTVDLSTVRYRIEQAEKDGAEEPELEELEHQQLWPLAQPRELADDVPACVREVFHEAATAECHALYRLAGVGYRSAVEAMCKERGSTGGNIKARIDGLNQVAGLPQNVVDGLQETRIVGNDSVHDGLAYSAEEIADLAGYIEEAAYLLYVVPAERARMSASRSARRSASQSGAALPAPAAGRP